MALNSHSQRTDLTNHCAGYKNPKHKVKPMLAENPGNNHVANNFSVAQIRAFLSYWLRKAKRALQNLVTRLKQLREQLYRSKQEKQREIEYQIHQILVNLGDKQRRALRSAIALLDEILPSGSDRQIELALCEVANIVTHRTSLGSLHRIRGSYGYLSEKQEAIIWQIVGAYKRWFSMGTKVVVEEVATEVTEAVADLDATLDAEQEEEIPGAIEWAIEKAGEAIQSCMPHLLPSPLPPAPSPLYPSNGRTEGGNWDNWEAAVWKAVSQLKRRFGWGKGFAARGF